MSDINKRIEEHLNAHDVILYMKGDRVFPQCGFSARVVEILDSTGVNYHTHDILSDPDMRQGLKDYSNWPTFPQLYVKAELVGGCDIITNMAETGELKKLFQDKGVLAA